MSDIGGPANPDVLQRIRHYRQYRRKFYIKVYLFAGIFVFISLVQWCVTVFLPFIGDFLTDFLYLPIGFLFTALFIISIFAMSETLRFKFPLNLIMGVLFVECMVVGLMAAFAQQKFVYFFAVFMGTVLLVAIGIAVGVYIPRDLTLDVVILFVFAVIFFIGSVAFLSLALLANVFYSVLVYSAFVILTVLMFLMYHAQTIHGERYAEMRIRDYILAALIIYSDFIILLLMAIFLVKLLTTGSLVSIGARRCAHCETNTPVAKILEEEKPKSLITEELTPFPKSARLFVPTRFTWKSPSY